MSANTKTKVSNSNASASADDDGLLSSVSMKGNGEVMEKGRSKKGETNDDETNEDYISFLNQVYTKSMKHNPNSKPDLKLPKGWEFVWSKTQSKWYFSNEQLRYSTWSRRDVVKSLDPSFQVPTKPQCKGSKRLASATKAIDEKEEHCYMMIVLIGCFIYTCLILIRLWFEFSRNNAFIGTRSVLMVRVISNDSSTTASQERLSYNLFGTNVNDTWSVNLRTQYAACSHNKLIFHPATGHNITDGVTTAILDKNTCGVSAEKVTAMVSNALDAQLGISASRVADHVMLCLPPNTLVEDNWAAFAYALSYLSVYYDKWCTDVSVQMHEVGHNLGFGHSGEGTDEYADRSGHMGGVAGSPPKRCFNGHKSWQSGWYADRHATWTPVGAASREYNLVGVIDYPSGEDNVVVLKLHTPGSVDHYVNFNRRSGRNSKTEYGDKVLITSAWDDRYLRLRPWLPFADSTLKAKLGAGETYSIPDTDLNVTVVAIDFFSSPVVATVCVSSAGSSCEATNFTQAATESSITTNSS